MNEFDEAMPWLRELAQAAGWELERMMDMDGRPWDAAELRPPELAPWTLHARMQWPERTKMTFYLTKPNAWATDPLRKSFTAYQAPKAGLTVGRDPEAAAADLKRRLLPEALEYAREKGAEVDQTADRMAADLAAEDRMDRHARALGFGPANHRASKYGTHGWGFHASYGLDWWPQEKKLPRAPARMKLGWYGTGAEERRMTWQVDGLTEPEALELMRTLAKMRQSQPAEPALFGEAA